MNTSKTQSCYQDPPQVSRRDTIFSLLLINIVSKIKWIPIEDSHLPASQARSRRSPAKFVIGLTTLVIKSNVPMTSRDNPLTWQIEIIAAATLNLLLEQPDKQKTFRGSENLHCMRN